MRTNDVTTTATVRLPAEWEQHDCVLMAWPHIDTDWVSALDDARDCVAAIIQAISSRECVLLVGPSSLCSESIKGRGFDPARVRWADIPTNDTWARDFGPITVETPEGALRALDFKFNAWGMKFAADRDNLICRALGQSGSLAVPLVNKQGFVLEGGSIESDGCGTILTTAQCLLSPNRNGQLDEDQIKETLRRELGATHQLWLHHGAMAGDDTDSHIDTLARLAPNDTILYTGATDSQGLTVEQLALMRDELASMHTPQGKPYNLVELPLPDPIYDCDGMQLPATYANYLVSPTTIFMPVYNQPLNDRRACDTVRVAYPHHEVVPLDCRTLIGQHGSLHCITMQLPSGTVAGIDSKGCWCTEYRNL